MDIVNIIVSCLAIFAIVLFITRIAGLRTFAKMSSIDFASTIAIGSVIASTILSDKTSIIQGAIALVCIVTVQVGIARGIKRYKWISETFTNQPILLMKNGEIIVKNLNRSGVSEEDLMAKLREANALKIENVKAVVFETTGDISVLHGDFKEEIDERILIGVQPH